MKTNMAFFGVLVLAFLPPFQGIRAAEEKESAREAAKPHASSELSAGSRGEMATAHEKMAECLRSDRPIAECRGQIMAEACPMMGDGPMMKDGRMLRKRGG